MYTIIYFIFLFCACCECFAPKYHSDIEYENLPPLFELDDYYACLQNSDTYCMVTLELHGEPYNIVYNMLQEYSNSPLKRYNHKILDRGVCVEKTCGDYIRNNGLTTNTDLEVILEGCFNKTIGQTYNLETRISSMTCERRDDEKDPVNTMDFIVAAVVVILLVSVAIGSYYDLNPKKCNENLGTGHQSLLCFSIFRNAERLTRENNDTQLSEFKGIAAIRVISESLVVYGHVSYLFAGFITNPHAFEKSYDSPIQRVVFSASSLVQLFFFLSGFILAFTLQITEEKQPMSWKNIPQFIFSRWWRLTPPLALVIAIMATWFRFLGSGPLWKRHVVDGVSSQCSTYYWTHIFYFNNYMRDEHLCSPESWHVAVDTQLFIIGLVVHMFIRKKSWTFKLCTLSVLLLIGIISPIAHVVYQDLDGFFVLSPEGYRTLRDVTFRTYHIMVQNNIACYILGMGNGYLIYYFKQKRLQYPNFKVGKFLSWLVIPALTSVFYVASTHLEDGERPSMTSRVLFAATHRVVIGLIVTFHKLADAFKFNHFSKHIFERSGWQILGKLSYCVYLIHDNILHYLMATRTELATFTFSHLIYMYIVVMALSHVLALMLHLLVEAPAIQLLKMFTSNRNKKKKA